MASLVTNVRITYFIPTNVLVISFVFVLACGLGLLTAFNAGTLIILFLPQIREHPGLRAIALKPFQSAFQRLIVLDMDFRH